MSHSTNEMLLEERDRLLRRVAELESQLQGESEASQANTAAAGKRAVESLEKREKYFRLFLQLTCDCFWNWDMVAGTVERSSGFERAFGYTEQEILPGIEWWSDRVHPEDEERVLQVFKAAVAKEQSTCSYEYRFRCRDGSYAIIDDHVCLIRDTKGTVVRSLGAMRDITDHRQAEKTLRNTQKQLDSFFVESPAGLAIIDDQFRYLKINETLANINGPTVEEHIGQTVQQIIPNLVPRVMPMFQKVVSEGSAFLNVEVNGETPGRPEDLRQWMISYFPIASIQSAANSIGVVVIETTERKRAEELLEQAHDELEQRVQERTAELAAANQKLTEEIEARKKTEQELRLSSEIMENMAEGVNLVRVSDGVLVYTNVKFDKMFGYEKGELNGKHVSVLNAAGDQSPQEVAKSIIATLQEKGSWLGDIHNVRKDGEIFWSRTTVSSFKHPVFGDVWVSVLENISEKRNAEQELRESEERFRRLTEVMPTGMYACDIEGRITFFNEQAATLWGTKPNLGDTDKRFCGSFRLYQPDGSSLLPNKTPMATALREGRSFRNQEVIIERPDGVRTIVLANVDPIHDSSGVRLGAVNVFFDVTELRQAEETLQKSEKRLDLAVRGTFDGIWDTNLDTKEEYWSPRFKELLGYKEDELQASFEQFHLLLHPEEKSAVLESIRLHLVENQPYDLELRMQTKSGEYRWFQSRGEALRDENGKPFRMAGSIRDINERKLIDKALQESEQSLIQAEAMAKMGHWRLNPQTGEVSGSEQLYRMFGLPKDESSLDLFLEIIHPEEREHALQVIQRGVDHGESWEFDYRLLHKDGTSSLIRSIGGPCLDETSNTTLLVGTVQDITERKRAEEEVRGLQEKLTHVTRLSTLGEMATGLAHELNQPLAAISTYCYAGELALSRSEPASPERLGALFEKMSGQALRAGEIIRRLRALVRKRPPIRGQADLTNLIQEVIQLLESDARQSETQIEFQAEPSNFFVIVDETQIQQVLVNLIRNAFDAMSEMHRDQKSLTIILSETGNGFIRVAVSDTGKGISAKQKDQVFDAFYSTKPEGMGMGLAISRTIIESHGGHFWMSSKAGSGATFYFTLPSAKDKVDCSEVSDSSHASSD